MSTPEEAFREHREVLVRYVYQLTADAAASEDVVQEAYVRLLERGPEVSRAGGRPLEHYIDILLYRRRTIERGLHAESTMSGTGEQRSGSVAVVDGADDPAAEDLTDRLKALAHPVRLRMVELIRERGEVCACEFEGNFDLTQPTLSHHLKALREAGLVTSRRDGVRSLQRIDPEAFGVLARWSREVAAG